MSRAPLEAHAERLAQEIKVTFDTEELSAFFDAFAPLESGADLFDSLLGELAAG